jgi:hypothetical protein
MMPQTVLSGLPFVIPRDVQAQAAWAEIRGFLCKCR